MVIKENEVEEWTDRFQTAGVAWYGLPSAFVVLGRLLNLVYPQMQDIGLELAGIGLNRFNIYRVTPVEIMGTEVEPELPLTLDEFVKQEWPKFEMHGPMDKWMSEYMSLMVVYTPQAVLESLSEKTYATYEKLVEGASEDEKNDLLWIKDAAEVMKKGAQYAN